MHSTRSCTLVRIKHPRREAEWNWLLRRDPKPDLTCPRTGRVAATERTRSRDTQKLRTRLLGQENTASGSQFPGRCCGTTTGRDRYRSTFPQRGRYSPKVPAPPPRSSPERKSSDCHTCNSECWGLQQQCWRPHRCRRCRILHILEPQNLQAKKSTSRHLQ